MTSEDKARIEGKTDPSETESEGKGLRIPNAIEDVPGRGWDNSTRGKVHGNEEATGGAADAVPETHGGARGDGANQSGGADTGDDSTVDTNTAIERFITNTKLRLKPDTQHEFSGYFRRFAEAVNLKGYTRRQLTGPKGKTLIMEYLATKTKPSWRALLVRLRSVWTNGLNLPWPIEVERDLGKLPKCRRGDSPPDDTVKKWSEAMKHEPDTYLKLLWLLIAQHGWRPSHVMRLKWRNIQYQNGKPYAIIADGQSENFKTASPIAVKLTKDVADTIGAWRSKAPGALPEKPILPMRFAKGRYDPDRELDSQKMFKIWHQIQSRWSLPALRPKDLRHWVATSCRKAGLSKQASAYMMGHDSAAGGAMRDWYDSPQRADVFDEQNARLPRGPLGLLDPPEIQIIEGLPGEAIELLRSYLAGSIGTFEYATRMELIKTKTQSPTQQTAILTP